MTGEDPVDEFRAAARRAQRDGQRARALEMYQQLCGRPGATADDWCSLGTIFGTSGELGRAEQCFLRALELDPDWPEAQCNLGVVYESRGQRAHAAECYRAALARNPGDAGVARNLVELMCADGDLDAAQSVVDGLRGPQAASPQAVGTLQGRIYQHGGDIEAAIREYQSVLARRPEQVEARLWLADLLLDCWRCEQALQHFRKLATIRPRDPGVLNNLTVTLVRLGRLTAAAAMCERVLAINPGHAGARDNRARIEGQLAAYDRWHTAYQTLTERDRTVIRRRIADLPARPLWSLLLPVNRGNTFFLERLLAGVAGQLYEHWELLCAVTSGVTDDARELLAARAAADPRIRLVPVPGDGSTPAANAALDVALGEYLAVVGESDEISEHALYSFVEEINRAPRTLLLYGDEDRIDEDGRLFDPWFRPKWNPDLLLSQDYIGTFAGIRTADLRRAGGFRDRWAGYEGWDLLLRLTADADPEGIRHVPLVVYHRRVLADGDEPGAVTADPAVAAAMLETHLAGRGVAARVRATPLPVWRVSYPPPDPAPLVTIIIPTRDRRDLLEPCVQSVFEKTRYPNYELLIVDNQTVDPDALAFLEALAADRRVRILPHDAAFNYAAICNRAAAEARGEVLVFLNNDTEVISPDWLDELVGQALRPEVGIVGAMLYFPDGRIQHAGVASMPPGHGWIYHLHAFHPHHYRDSRGRARATQCRTAVTGACQAVRKAVYAELGGMDEANLVVSFNDIELCFKSRAAGYRVIWTPWAELYHRESATTGNRIDRLEDRERAGREYEWLRRRWSTLLDADPATNPNMAIGRDADGLAWPPRVRLPWAPGAPAVHTRPMHYLAVAAIVKDERRYLEEWVRFHAGIGVEHFFIYDNGSTDGTPEWLERQDRRRITVHRLPGTARQGAAYWHCAVQRRDDARWIAFIDADEFIVPDRSLPELLADFEPHPALCVHWRLFGSNGQRSYDSRPVIERFTRRAAAVDSHVKSIIDPRRTRRFVTAHKFVHAGAAVDENHRPIGDYDSRPAHGTCDRIQINHYLVKSREECLERRGRPTVDVGRPIESPEEYFARHDLNEVEDLRALAIWRRLAAR